MNKEFCIQYETSITQNDFNKIISKFNSLNLKPRSYASWKLPDFDNFKNGGFIRTDCKGEKEISTYCIDNNNQGVKTIPFKEFIKEEINNSYSIY